VIPHGTEEGVMIVGPRRADEAAEGRLVQRFRDSL
jgi:hypothetical protein